jgi:hypothetical protein
MDKYTQGTLIAIALTVVAFVYIVNAWQGESNWQCISWKNDTCTGGLSQWSCQTCIEQGLNCNNYGQSCKTLTIIQNSTFRSDSKQKLLCEIINQTICDQYRSV